MRSPKDTDIKDLCGSQIAFYRTAIRITQKELAERIGMSKLTVVFWETGRIVPSLRRLCDIADALDVHVYQLFIPVDKLVRKRKLKRPQEAKRKAKK